ncbi:hypothetical protein FOZ63_005816, partial [Perkinsus olseni]
PPLTATNTTTPKDTEAPRSEAKAEVADGRLLHMIRLSQLVFTLDRLGSHPGCDHRLFKDGIRDPLRKAGAPPRIGLRPIRRASSGLVYTPEEEAQHFDRFEEDLRSQLESISTEAAAKLYDETRPAIMKSFVDEINSMQTTWTASAEQGRFRTMAFRDIKRLCGSFLNRTENLKEKVYPPEELRSLPASFDARDGFKDCADVIGHV